MLAIIFLLLPFFALIALGFLLGARNIFDAAATKTLTRFVFLVAMPVAVFNFFSSNNPPDITILRMMIGYIAAMLAMWAIAPYIGKKFFHYTPAEAGAFGFVAICGNAVFLGLPITFSIPGWTGPFLFLMVAESLLVFGIGAALMSQSARAEQGKMSIAKFLSAARVSIIRSLKNPIVIGALLGFSFSLLPISLPEPVHKIVALLGATAAPLGLIALGLTLAGMEKNALASVAKPVTTITVLKLILFPLLTALSVGLLTGWDKTYMLPAIFFTALPPAVTSFVQAAHYRVLEKVAGMGVMIGTLASLVTITIFLTAVM